jgi:hypothetical protein
VLLQGLQELVNKAAVSSGLSGWAVVLGSLLVVLVSAVLGEWLWTRLRYDMHKIPTAPNSVPVLGEFFFCCSRGYAEVMQLQVTLRFQLPFDVPALCEPATIRLRCWWCANQLL